MLFVSKNKIISHENQIEKFDDILYSGISEFFISNYKKITQEVMDTIYEKVDFDYIFSLPYPAEFKDQKYLMDESRYPEKFNK